MKAFLGGRAVSMWKLTHMLAAKSVHLSHPEAVYLCQVVHLVSLSGIRVGLAVGLAKYSRLCRWKNHICYGHIWKQLAVAAVR